MNLSIVSAIFVISVSLNQAIGGMIKDLPRDDVMIKDVRDIPSVVYEEDPDAVSDPDSDAVTDPVGTPPEQDAPATERYCVVCRARRFEETCPGCGLELEPADD